MIYFHGGPQLSHCWPLRVGHPSLFSSGQLLRIPQSPAHLAPPSVESCPAPQAEGAALCAPTIVLFVSLVALRAVTMCLVLPCTPYETESLKRR